MVAENTTATARKKNTQKYTLVEYFQLETQSSSKNEFLSGKIIPMAGGTIEHGKISGNIYALLLMLFFNKDEITVFTNDQKIYISDFERSTYADTCVVVGEVITYQGGNQAILNPTLVVEVASDSTEQHDRTTKFRMYQSLPSFEEYVLVSQEMPIVEVFYKIAANKWQMSSYVGLDKVVRLETLSVELKMSDIYKKIHTLKDPQTAFSFPENI